MARTSAGAALTKQHYENQLRLRALVLRDFARIWPLWRGDKASFLRLVDATVPLIRANHQLSASLAASYYQAFRLAEGVGGEAATRLGQALDEDRVRASLFVTGEEMTRTAVLAGSSADEAMRTALVRVSGSATRHTLSGGRDTVILSSAADNEAAGWARVTAANPCGFCATLASRGPVYSESTADFKAHDHCSCSAEVSYRDSEWPGRAREFHRLYNEVASGSKNPINEMRKALAAN